MSDNKKTVALATCFLDNYGACLQAYALQESIESLGYKCNIINYVEPDGYSKHLPWLTKFMHSEFYLKGRGFFQHKYLEKFNQEGKKWKKFYEFRKGLNLTGFYTTAQQVYDHPPLCDACVCGSDQIWNPTFYNCNNPIYHLDFAPKGIRRIAYAPSIGLSSIPYPYQKEFQKFVSALDVVSVRETRGAEIIKEITDRDCPVVLDPTLLINGQQWREKLQIKQKKHPYIFVYMFGDREYIGKFLQHVRERTDIPFVCIPFTERDRNAGYEIVNDAGPREFVELIDNASLVLTDSFHATAFSLNLNTPFYTLFRDKEDNTKGMNSRLTSILELTGMGKRLIKNEENFPGQIDFDVDFSACNQCLQDKRKKDLEFLKNALGGSLHD